MAQRGSTKNTISVRLALEGAEDVRKAFKDLASGGKTAFRDIKAALEQVDGPMSRANAALLRLSFDMHRSLIPAAERFGRSLGRLGNAARTAVLRISALGAAIGAAGAGLASLSVYASKSAKEHQDLAQGLGLTIGEYGRLAFATEQVELSQENLRSAFGKLSKDLTALTKGGLARASGEFGEFGISVRRAGDETADSFSRFGVRVRRGVADLSKGKEEIKSSAEVLRELGITATTTDGKVKSTFQIINELADVFAAMPDGIEKSAIAVRLFEQEIGPKLIPLLNKGSAGLKELGDVAEALGLVFDEQAAKTAKAFDLQYNIIKGLARGIRNELGLIFAPTLTRAGVAFVEMVQRNRKALRALADELVRQVVPAAEDLIFALSGQDERVRNPQILEMRDAVLEFARATQLAVTNVVIPAFHALVEAADFVAAALNGVFGTEFTGQQLLIAAAILKLTGVLGVLFAAIRVVVSGFSLLLRSGAAIARFLATLAGGALPAIVAGLKTAGAWVARLVAGFGRLFALTGFRGLLAAIGRIAVAVASFVAGIIGWPALIVAALAAAGVAIYAFWDDIKAAAAAVVDWLRDQFPALWSYLAEGWDSIASAAIAAWDRITGALSGIWDDIRNGAALAFDGLKQIFADVPEAIRGALAVLPQLLATVWDQVSGGASRLWDGIVGAAGGVPGRISQAFTQGREIIASAFRAIAGFVTKIWSGASDRIADAAGAIVDAIAKAIEISGDIEGAAELAAALAEPFRNAAKTIDEILASLKGLVARAFSDITGSLRSLARDVARILDDILDKLRRAREAAREMRALERSSGGSGFATGGMVRGPGTSRSDSIPAWLSNGEFVIRADAVRHYGAAFLSALNSMRLGKDRVPGFASGGLVDLSALSRPLSASLAALMPGPGFAAGGLVEVQAVGPQGRPITLHLGNEIFEMAADDDTADRLNRFVSNQRARRIGSTPGWYGG